MERSCRYSMPLVRMYSPIRHQLVSSLARLFERVVARSAKAAFIFGHFFGGFWLTTTSTPHFSNVTDNHRYSWLIADFQSVEVGVIIVVSGLFSQKGVILTFLGWLFELS